jgi:hypothetical protein
MPSISLPTAVLIGSGLAAGGAVASSVVAGNAAKRAAGVQADAAKVASDRALAQYGETKNNLAPYIDAGKGGLAEEQNLLGLGSGGAADPGKINSFLEKTPGYAFTLDQGLKSTQNGFAAQGLGSSGAALKGAAQFSTGLASQQYETILQNYMKLAGQGQDAATTLGGQGLTATGNANAYSTSGAAATAGGIIGGANALTAGINGVTSQAGNAALMLGLNNAGMFGKTTNPLAVGSPGAVEAPKDTGMYVHGMYVGG